MIALIVGHSEKDPGAYNKDFEITEYQFNDLLAKTIRGRIVKDPPITLLHRQTSIRELVERINALNPNLCISLHCNAATSIAEGNEVLYWHTSSKGKAIAELGCVLFSTALNNRMRGAKSIKMHDRGWYLLAKTKCPAVICEPFFIDNNDELMNALNKFTNLVDAYVNLLKLSYEIATSN